MEHTLFDRHKLDADYQMALRLRGSLPGNIQRVVEISTILDVRPIIKGIFRNADVFVSNQTKPVSPKTTKGYVEGFYTSGFIANPVFHDVFIKKDVSVINDSKEPDDKQIRRIGVRTVIQDPVKEPRKVTIYIGYLDFPGGTSRTYNPENIQELKKLIEEVLKTGHTSKKP